AWRLNVGGEDRTVAVDDIGPGGCDRVLRSGAARAVAVGADGVHHQPTADDGVDRDEGQHRKPDTRARLGGAVDIAPVEQAADQPLPPRLGFTDVAHRLAPGCGTEPVMADVSALDVSALASSVPIIEAIGSGSPGLKRL